MKTLAIQPDSYLSLLKLLSIWNHSDFEVYACYQVIKIYE